MLIKSKDDIKECVAKRSWGKREIQTNIPGKVANLSSSTRTGMSVAAKTGLASAKPPQREEGTEKLSDEEVKTKAERCMHYWEVERHCFQKLAKQENEEISKAVPLFLGVYTSEGGVEIVDGYGLIDAENEGGWFNGDNSGADGHEWMVFESVQSVDGSSGALTLLDAMEVSHLRYMHIFGNISRIHPPMNFFNHQNNSDGLEKSRQKAKKSSVWHTKSNGSTRILRVW